MGGTVSSRPAWAIYNTPSQKRREINKKDLIKPSKNKFIRISDQFEDASKHIPLKHGIRQAWWYTLIIPGRIWEDEAEGLWVSGQPGISSETLSQKQKTKNKKKSKACSWLKKGHYHKNVDCRGEKWPKPCMHIWIIKQ
jgi:hypothetical protein